MDGPECENQCDDQPHQNFGYTQVRIDAHFFVSHNGGIEGHHRETGHDRNHRKLKHPERRPFSSCRNVHPVVEEPDTERFRQDKDDECEKEHDVERHRKDPLQLFPVAFSHCEIQETGNG